MGDDLSIGYESSDTRQRRVIGHFIQHPEFNRETFENDIAVIRVRKMIFMQLFCSAIIWHNLDDSAQF